MNCIGNTGKKDILYKGRRIGEGENYMLDKDGNYIDSITDNTKEISELTNQLKELLSKGDEENDNLTKQFAEIQDKINTQVDEKLKALERVMEGSMEKAAVKSALNIVTATYSKAKDIKESFGSFWPKLHFNGGGYDIKLPANALEHVMSKYTKTSDDVIAYQLAGIKIGTAQFNYISGYDFSASNGINGGYPCNIKLLPAAGSTINLGAREPSAVVYRFVEYFQADNKTIQYC